MRQGRAREIHCPVSTKEQNNHYTVASHKRVLLWQLWPLQRQHRLLQTKPMWAFVVVIPLILGRYRFFIKLLALAVAVYVVVAGATIVIAGPSYGWQQYSDYFTLLLSLGSEFPWRDPGAPFLGYNHSIKQSIVYLLGVSPSTFRLATVIKALLLIPLAAVCVRNLLCPVRKLLVFTILNILRL